MTNRTKAALLVLILAAFLAAPAAAADDPIKIRVTSASAVLRLSASPRGEVAVDKVPVGTVFEAVRKTGAWYEIRHRSEIGVLLTAFISESDVEVVGAAAVPAKVKPAATKPTPAPKPAAAVASRPAGSGGLELGIGGGLAMPGFKDWSGTYNDSFSGGSLQAATESGQLSLSAKSPVAVGLSVAYFFGPKVGVKLRLDYLTKQGFQNGDSAYTLTWRWVGSPEYNRNKDWGLGGDLTAMPISLNGVFRFMDGPKLAVWGEAGLSVVMAKLKGTSTAGYGMTWISGLQYIDYFDVPIIADASKTAFGFNAGLGAEVKIGSKLGAFLEAGLIMAGALSADWKSQLGTYPSNLNAGWTLNFTDASAESLDGILPALEAKLTFIRLAAGVHIRI